MCGIAGFSLNAASTINARALAHALLTAIERRGAMSSGIAYPGVNGGIEVYKDAVAGSNLPLRTVPRNTKTAILHTRFATKGSPQDNTNNHPVWSPYSTIALVHNGVIWNDMSLRFGSLREFDEFMPEVDTACIPALLESKGVAGISELAGDAAVAWLDVADPHTLHLARIESSPVAYTNLADGSFVFASTPSLLRAALESMQLEHGEVFSQSELDYYRLRGGVIWNYTAVPQPVGYRSGLAASTRGATSGGHTSTGSSYVGREAVTGTTKDTGGSLFTTNDKGETEFAPVNETDQMEARAMALLEAEVDKIAAEEGTGAAPDQRQWDSISWGTADADEGEEGFIGGVPQYYTVDVDGNMESYETLEELETKLLYLAGRNGDEQAFGEGKVKWVNYFSDIGSFGFESETLISWLTEPDELQALSATAEKHDLDLSYIKDGVSLLAGMVGR